MPFHYFLVLVLVSLLWCWICFPFSWWWLHASWLTVNARWLSINAGWMWINIRFLSIQFDCLIIINKWLRFYIHEKVRVWVKYWNMLYWVLAVFHPPNQKIHLRRVEKWGPNAVIWRKLGIWRTTWWWRITRVFVFRVSWIATWVARSNDFPCHYIRTFFLK